MATTTEVERKYDVPVDFTLPDLSRLPVVAAVDPPREYRLDATYYDTPDLRLAAERVTLRRRAGGHDEGWHLKRPAHDGDRTETQVPLTEATAGVPSEIAAQVADLIGGEPLAPVAHIRTRRLERPLRAADGSVLALVADDVVGTEALGEPAVLRRWREVEVELVDGSRELLDSVDGVLREAGAQPGRMPSKLARALAHRVPGAPRPDPLSDYVRAQRDKIRSTEAGVRAGDPEAVHDMRVATRRLRSTLRTFRALLDAERTEPLRAELHWLAGLLGAVRDGDVLAERLTRAVAAEPPDNVIGPVAQRIRDRLGADTAPAREELIDALDGVRYRSLLDGLDQLVSAGVPTRPTRRRLLRRARKALRRADRTLAAADAAEPAADQSEPAADAAEPAADQSEPAGQAGHAAEGDRDVLLHEARKGYKRARYAAETVRPLAGKPARRLVKALTRLQDVLGAHQDAIVAGEVLRELGERADAQGENAFTYGMLRERQREAAQRSLSGLPKVRRRAGRRKVRRWLSG
jgi:CHAD domain-containing protein